MKPPNKDESRIIKFMILLGIFSICNFLAYFFHPEHIGNPFLYGLLTVSILYGILKKVYLWYNYSNITIPKPPPGEINFKVDVLTTYFPGEPYQMIITTLEAILDISYPHETFLCDEANDPYLKKFCEENGIHHVTRDNRINAKAGNINNALQTVARGEVCVVLDPDHVPDPDFLDPILPYFNDPRIGFVQIVQSYYNIEESLVARGAAEQTFQFYGPVMMTLNSYGTVNAIGANCVFRREALDSIGGHAPGLCEDMHTAMLLYSKGWKAVYLPVVLAKGLAPSNLTGFFKQQLKWARGSFDLLINVYPKIFRKLTWRQKIHFGILPMHYLSGLISFINFLIPILALLFATTPWRGNIIEFGLVILPVIASSIFIRTYIQKWIIEKKERGFHLIGGLLHINTWWIHLLGLYYTITNKKILYLPTPKENEWATNLRIIIPNAVIALISVLAIIYGLRQDFTPFSLVMAGFAFFNACIMSFGIFMAIKVSNQSSFLKIYFRKKWGNILDKIKEAFYVTSNALFNFSRILALPLLLLVLIFSMSFKQQKSREKWEDVRSFSSSVIPDIYLGIFNPSEEGGLTDLEETRKIEAGNDIDFDIISYYIAWTPESITEFPHQLTSDIFKGNDIPMITWEPWASPLAVKGTIEELKLENKVFKHITLGHYDEYLNDFIAILKSYDKPFFLRFAHEFDNPQYPWSAIGNNTPEEFIAAWRYLHDKLKKEGAHKVILVWNPWKSQDMAAYYPGDDYVDWIGITALNYDKLNENNRHTSFRDLYQPFHEQLLQLSGKPVMLAEFGSLNLEGKQEEWIREAISVISSEYSEISAVVLFNSTLDANIPSNSSSSEKELDWSIGSWQDIQQGLGYDDYKLSPTELPKDTGHKNSFDELSTLKGVRYKKNINWRQNYYSLTKQEINKDIDLMKQANINTLLLRGGNIYDYNILRYTETSNLNLLYSFNIDFSVDPQQNESYWADLKEDILDKVEDQKNRTNIIGYVFPGNIEDFIVKPEAFDRKNFYYQWLKSVLEEVRKIDPDKPLVLELLLNSETSSEISLLFERLPIDAFGLILRDALDPEEFFSFAESAEIPLFISSLHPEHFTENPQFFGDIPVILQNWQDERFFNRLTHDGIVDFDGRKKPVFKALQKEWTNSEEELDNHQIKILRPAEALYPGNPATYQAVLFDGTSWRIMEDSEEYQYEWNLLKHDQYGNPIALKKLGKGVNISLKTPPEYERYKLLLTAIPRNKDYVLRIQSSLHTPWIGQTEEVE